MFNSKYSKLLTVVLVITIIGIVGVLAFLGIDYYKKLSTTSGANNAIHDFDSYVNNIGDNEQNNGNNTNIADENVVLPDLDYNNILGNTQQGGNNGGQSGSSNNSNLTHKGFKVAGKIEIPKTKIQYLVLTEVTPKSIEASVGILYGPGINEVGNTVIIGHNYRNGTFFSNNQKLSLGDKIYLTDLKGKKVTYEITKKYTTGTDDFSYAVRDTNGKREISLSTCTNNSKDRLIIWAREV